MRTFIFTFICFLIVSIGKAEEARLIRFPHINGKQIVFSYAGDLYTVSDQGGTARKLTSDIGYEMFPRISPDGKYIAFTGQYDGNTEVFVIPSAGGIPRRLTYTATLNRDDLGDRMGPNNIVIGWTPDMTGNTNGSRTGILWRCLPDGYGSCSGNCNPADGLMRSVTSSWQYLPKSVGR